MNIQTVLANLLNTIKGKEKMLERNRIRLVQRPALDDATYYAIKYTVDFLELNLKELNAILADCMAVREADIVRNLEAKDQPVSFDAPDFEKMNSLGFEVVCYPSGEFEWRVKDPIDGHLRYETAWSYPSSVEAWDSAWRFLQGAAEEETNGKRWEDNAPPKGTHDYV